MVVASVAVALLLQGAGWTWTLYEAPDSLVLANEIPDSPRLRTVLECDPGAGVARLSLYDTGLAPGFATLSAGEDTAAAEAAAARDGALALALRTDHPAFNRFVAGGRLEVAVGARRAAVVVPRPHLARLRRFAELCGG